MAGTIPRAGDGILTVDDTIDHGILIPGDVWEVWYGGAQIDHGPLNSGGGSDWYGGWNLDGTITVFAPHTAVEDSGYDIYLSKDTGGGLSFDYRHSAFTVGEPDPLPDPSNECDAAPRLIVCDAFTDLIGVDIDGRQAPIGGFWDRRSPDAYGRIVLDDSTERRLRQRDNLSHAWFCWYINDEDAAATIYDVYGAFTFLNDVGKAGLVAGFDPVTDDYFWCEFTQGSPGGAWNVGYGQETGYSTGGGVADSAMPAGDVLQVRMALRGSAVRVYANRGAGWYQAYNYPHAVAVPLENYAGLLLAHQSSEGLGARLDDFRLLLPEQASRRRGYSQVY
jgi:hypothetical protein